jgi:hypothetical protein
MVEGAIIDRQTADEDLFHRMMGDDEFNGKNDRYHG